MRIKTSVSLDSETLQAIDGLAGRHSNRSRLIEEAILEYVDHRRRLKRDARDREILERSADRLNEELEDLLAYQVEL